MGFLYYGFGNVGQVCCFDVVVVVGVVGLYLMKEYQIFIGFFYQYLEVGYVVVFGCQVVEFVIMGGEYCVVVQVVGQVFVYGLGD